MDIAQLQLILDTVKTVSGDATTVAIAWIVCEVLLSWVGLMTFITLLYKFFRYLVASRSLEGEIKSLGERLGTGRAAGYFNAEEKAKTLRKLRELVLKHEQEKG